MRPAVIAGGGAERLGGIEKALLPLRPGGPSLMGAIIEAIEAAAGAPAWISTRRPARYAAFQRRCIEDEGPPQGPLGGIAACLRALEAEGGEALLIAAGDAPFLAPGLLRLLIDEGNEAAVTLCRQAGALRPFPAVVRRGALAGVELALKAGQRSIWRCTRALGARVIEEERWRPFDPRGRSFDNVNAPGDLETLLGMSDGAAYLRGAGAGPEG